MGEVDAVHRGAHADDRGEEVNFLLGVLLFESVHEVQFCADGPFSSWRRGFDCFDDLAGGTSFVGEFEHFAGTFGVNKNLNARMFFAEQAYVLRAEHLMYAAVTFPEDHLAFENGFRGIAAELFGMRIPDRHLRERDAHADGCVAAQVLIGEEHHAAGSRERPVERGFGVRRRADDSAVSTDEGFKARGRVDVGDRCDVRGVNDLTQLIPGVFNLMDAGHVGHRAAGGEVGEYDANSLAVAFGQFLGAVPEDVGRFGHEVDSAKRDVPTLAAVGSHLAELIAIAGEVRECDHLILLIMVTQNQQFWPQFVADGLDALLQLVVRERLVGLQFEVWGCKCGGHSG